MGELVKTLTFNLVLIGWFAGAAVLAIVNLQMGPVTCLFYLGAIAAVWITCVVGWTMLSMTATDVGVKPTYLTVGLIVLLVVHTAALFMPITVGQIVLSIIAGLMVLAAVIVWVFMTGFDLIDAYIGTVRYARKLKLQREARERDREIQERERQRLEAAN